MTKRRPPPPDPASSSFDGDADVLARLTSFVVDKQVPEYWHASLIAIMRRQARALIPERGSLRGALEVVASAYADVVPSHHSFGLILAAVAEEAGYEFEDARATARLFIRLRQRFLNQTPASSPEQLMERLCERLGELLQRFAPSSEFSTASRAALSRDPLLLDDAIDAFVVAGGHPDRAWTSRSGITVTLEDSLGLILLAAASGLRGPTVARYIGRRGLKWVRTLRALINDGLLDQSAMLDLVRHPELGLQPRRLREELECWDLAGREATFYEFLLDPWYPTSEDAEGALNRLCERVLQPSSEPVSARPIRRRRR